ncbi:MAG: ring-cleaving dioxygenase [Gemmatimonadota bacterium]|nr:ring-cleaving dioxygenase [Gemmatimonadota bacterium]
MELTGIHHLTAISGDIRNNRRFYTGTLGMRLVKRSVNQDDTKAYHLFYADQVGTPGTDLTFFDWNVPKEQRGANNLTLTSLRVTGKRALLWWKERFASEDIKHDDIFLRDNRWTLEFEDAEGQRLALIDDGGIGNTSVPVVGSSVPLEHQIHGLGPVMMSIHELPATDAILQQVLRFKAVRTYMRDENADGAKAHRVHVYQIGKGGPGAELHVAVQPDVKTGHSGAGGVHHVAFRTPDVEQYNAWVERLAAFRLPNSGPVDRFWFKSLYFREPSGILFEIATDGPGFSVDENEESLGQKIVLPPFLEPNREEIVAGLKVID